MCVLKVDYYETPLLAGNDVIALKKQTVQVLTGESYAGICKSKLVDICVDE